MVPHAKVKELHPHIALSHRPCFPCSNSSPGMGLEGDACGTTVKPGRLYMCSLFSQTVKPGRPYTCILFAQTACRCCVCWPRAGPAAPAPGSDPSPHEDGHAADLHGAFDRHELEEARMLEASLLGVPYEPRLPMR